MDLDCMGTAKVCVGKACINEGNPRFTLQWHGKSIYSLTVITPGGKYISAFSPFDPDSGGAFEGPTQQRTSGDDVENIYFSIEGGPPGLYTYYAINSGVEISNDTWTMTVSVNGKTVATQTGSGKSDAFSFQFGTDDEMENKTPALVPPDQEGCDPLVAECCTNVNCSSNEICSYHICVKRGAPQFLLSWEGNYDVTLAVVPPQGKTISWQNPLDLESGGTWDEHIDTEKNRRIENIYFAPNKGPNGVYPYYVHSYQTDGEDDAWKVEIYIDGKEVSTESGQGSSEVLFFDYSGDKSILDNTSSDPPVHVEEACDLLTISDGQCCSDLECFPNEACASRNCVDEGNPRFTLSWEGENDLDLLVITPLGKAIFLSNTKDPESGGKFGEEHDQFEYGFHAENVYFPMDGGPVGEYSFYVRSFLSTGGDDKWTVGVYVNGEGQFAVSGTGNSEKLTYNFLTLNSYTS